MPIQLKSWLVLFLPVHHAKLDMIYKHKLQNLTEEEYGILYYCMNDGTDGERVHADNMNALKIKHIFTKLNDYASKVSEEKRHVFQSIIDKLEK